MQQQQQHINQLPSEQKSSESGKYIKISVLIIALIVMVLLLVITIFTITTLDNSIDTARKNRKSSPENVVYQEKTEDAHKTISEPTEKPANTQEPVSGEVISDYTNVSYEMYNNGRFGFGIPYPDFLIPQEPPQNGDGISFISEDGTIQMTAYGSHVAYLSESTIDALYDYTYENLSYEPTFTKKKDNYFVLSGYSGSDIIYQKHILKSDGTENCFTVIYPASLKTEFDPIIKHIAYNFTTGIGGDSPVAE